MDTATTEIYTLSLHDALPICVSSAEELVPIAWLAGRSVPLDPDELRGAVRRALLLLAAGGDRKSTRLNSSHGSISYAVFCLKKKKKKNNIDAKTTAHANRTES